MNIKNLMRKAHPFYALLTGLIAIVIACSDLPAPTGLKPESAPGSVSLSINAAVIYHGKANSRPVNFYRARVYKVGSTQAVVSKDADIAASETNLSIPLDIDPSTGSNFKITLELINKVNSTQTVEYAGLVPNVAVSRGDKKVVNLDIYPGPLSNFDVTAVSINEPIANVAVGGIAQISTTMTGNGGVVIWSSLDATATIDRTGVLEGVSPGTARIVAAVGKCADTATVTIVQGYSALGFSTTPSASAANGVAFTTQPVVELRDGSNNPVLRSGITITAAASTGLTIANATAVTNSQGRATFSGLSVTGTSGSGKQLTFSTTGATSLTHSFTLTAGAASTSTSTITPGSSSVSAGGTTTVTVQLKDASGNNLTTSGGAVAIGTTLGSLSAVTDNNNGTYTSTFTAPTTTGTATISAALALVSFANTATITVAPGAASRLVVTGSATQTAGATQTVTITAKDVNGNTATSYTGDKSLTFSGAAVSPSGSNPTATNKSSAATNFGTATTVTFTNGVATTSMALYKAEVATVAVTDGSLSSTGSDRLSVTVAEGALSATQSTLAATSSTISVSGNTTLTVTLKDASGNVVTTAGSSSFVLAKDIGSVGTASCTSGVCTATYTAPSTLGTASVTAKIGGNNISGSPATITVVAGPPANLVMSSGLTSYLAGSAQTVTITAKDAGGNTATSYTGDKVITFSGAGASPSGSNPTATDKNGVAVNFGTGTTITFTNGVATTSMTLYRVESPTVTATDGSLSTNGISAVVNHTNRSNSQSTLTALSTSVAANGTTTLTVTVRDTYGNLATTTSTSNLAVATNIGSVGSLSCSNAVCTTTFTAPGSAGTASVTAQFSGANIGGSPLSITVSAPPTATRLVVTGSSSQAAGSAQTVTITARDAGGAVATGYTGDKLITLSGPFFLPGGPFSPTGTNKTGTPVEFETTMTVTFTNGVATTSMILYAAGSETITVTDGTLSAAGADQLNVTVSALSTPNALASFMSLIALGSASHIPNTTGTLTISASIADMYGNPILTATPSMVTLSADVGSIGTVTCNFGICSATYTAPATPGTANISAKIGGVNIGLSPQSVTIDP